VEARKGTDLFISGYKNGIYWLYAADSAENISELEELSILGLGTESDKNQGFQVFPHPIVQSAIFSFTLDSDQEVWLSLMDSQGRVLRKEHQGHLLAGQNQIILQRDYLPAGIYYFRLEYDSGLARSGTLIIQD
jgi:hypothetical protein